MASISCSVIFIISCLRAGKENEAGVTDARKGSNADPDSQLLGLTFDG